MTRRPPSIVAIISLAMAITSPLAADAQPLIIAHRGASHDAPENTLAAFRLAWEQGADGVEGDFHLTRDGRIICVHDKDTKRVAGVDHVIAKTSYDELRRLDVGKWKDARFAGERMPTLGEVLATVPEGKLIFIEIKCGPEIVPVLKGELAGAALSPKQTVIISFDAAVIAAAKKAMPDRPAHWITGYKQDKQTKAWSPTRESVLATLKSCNADGLDTHAHETIDDAFARALRDRKLGFHCWTVDDPAVARRFIALGVESITTNRPKWLRERINDSAAPSR